MAVVRVHACATFPVDRPSALHDLARAFRAGDPAAFERVVGLVGEALGAGVPGLGEPAERGPGAVVAVAVPGHRAGTANAPCERLIARLAVDLAWMVPVPGALTRIADAPEGRTSPDRDVRAEAGTLRWTVDGLAKGGPVLLLDDVVRTGSTLGAAIAAAPPDLAARLVPVAVFRAVPGSPGGDDDDPGPG